MKECPNCKTLNSDQANFCLECGQSLSGVEPTEVQETPAQDPQTQILEEVEQEIDQAQQKQVELDLEKGENTQKEEPKDEPSDEENWYYVQSGESQGPYTKQEFIQLIALGKITPMTYVWTKGMTEWTFLKNTPLYAPADFQNPQVVPSFDEISSADEPVHEAESVGETASAEWYYVKANKTYGPFAQSVMACNIEQGLLDSSSYVWKEGFSDWKHLRDTELAAYLPYEEDAHTFQSTRQNTFGPGADSRPGWTSSSVQPRSVVGGILLTICTCWIYYYVWMYQQAKDINTLAAQQGRPASVDPAAAVLLSLVTCGLYQIYFFWKEGTVVYQLSNKRLSDSSTVLAILGFFLPIASMAILQDQINTLSQDGNR